MEYQNEQEFKHLFEIVKISKPECILEIGSMFGDTLKFWFTLKPKMVVSMDMLVPETDPRYDQQRHGHDILWDTWAKEYSVDFRLFENSHDPKAYDRISRIMPQIDFLFIDGDHSYEGVKQDFNLFAPLVKPGGIIALHDIVPNPQYGDIQVPKFWNEIKNHFFWRELIYDKNQFGIGVLVK